MLSKKQQQIFLKHCYGYYKGNIDGIIGSQTKKAIKSFQKKNKLKNDGIWGKKTEEKAKSKVKIIQKRLKKSGFLSGEIDGVIGENTISAIKKFQRYNNITASGIYNKKTASLLNLAYAKKIASEKKQAIPSKAVFSFQEENGNINWLKVKEFGFNKNEFKCRCKGKYCKGYPNEVSIYLLNALINIRKHFGGRVVITSGLRCKSWNKLQGGVKNSYHTKGKAADIIVYDKNGKIVLQRKVKAYAKKQKYFHYSYYGTKNMGKATHIDFSK